MKTFVEDIEGESVFIPRFLTPLRPPEQILDTNAPHNVNCNRAARYVSLIPYKEDTALFKDMPDLCCRS
jgi:coiled-coil and C2 domain-containing protein 2A